MGGEGDYELGLGCGEFLCDFGGGIEGIGGGGHDVEHGGRHEEEHELWGKKCKHFQGISQTLTRNSQRRCLMVNAQLRCPGLTLQDFIKSEDQICELNYRGTICEIGSGRSKVQFYHFFIIHLDFNRFI